MKLIKENFKYLVAVLLLVLSYFLIRIINLTTLPIFTDEAIYIRWAQIAKADAAWRFISLTDGKQPFLIWVMMITLKLISDPLFAGRFVSVITGVFSMLGVGLVSWEIFKDKKIAFLSSLLYLFSPFFLIYDRMALMDSMVAMFSIWSIFFALLLVKFQRLDIALILGIFLGGGVLTKTSGFINIYLLPLTLIFFDSKKKKSTRRLIKWIGLVFVAVVFSQLYYGILRLSPWFHMIAQKDTTFVYPFGEWRYTLRFFVGNLNGLFNWLSAYLTYPVVFMIAVALLFARDKWKGKIYLLLFFLVPFLGLALFGKVLYPRFILFMSLPLLMLASWGLSFIVFKFKAKIVTFCLLILFFLYPAYVDYKILFSIVTAPIPEADSGQYINDWPAGWGIREVVDIMEREAKDKKVAVYTDGTFGLLPYGLEIYLIGNPNVEIIGLWPIPKKMPESVIAKIEEKETYFVLNQTMEFSPFWTVDLLESYVKGKNRGRMLKLFKVNKPDESLLEYSDSDILN